MSMSFNVINCAIKITWNSINLIQPFADIMLLNMAECFHFKKKREPVWLFFVWSRNEYLRLTQCSKCSECSECMQSTQLLHKSEFLMQTGAAWVRDQAGEYAVAWQPNNQIHFFCLDYNRLTQLLTHFLEAHAHQKSRYSSTIVLI